MALWKWLLRLVWIVAKEGLWETLRFSMMTVIGLKVDLLTVRWLASWLASWNFVHLEVHIYMILKVWFWLMNTTKENNTTLRDFLVLSSIKLPKSLRKLSKMKIGLWGSSHTLVRTTVKYSVNLLRSIQAGLPLMGRNSLIWQIQRRRLTRLSVLSSQCWNQIADTDKIFSY